MSKRKDALNTAEKLCVLEALKRYEEDEGLEETSSLRQKLIDAWTVERVVKRKERVIR